MDKSIRVVTKKGRIYKYVGTWDSELVFAPDDGVDEEVMIYTLVELKDLIDQGRLSKLVDQCHSTYKLKNSILN